MSGRRSSFPQLAVGEDIGALIAYCEQFELNMGHSGLASAASLGVYKVHLAAYLMCEKLDDARFLWKRVPSEIRDADAEFAALWAIGKAMWVKDMAAAQAAMAGYNWTPPLLSGIVERMQREHLNREARLTWPIGPHGLRLLANLTLREAVGRHVPSLLPRSVCLQPISRVWCSPHQDALANVRAPTRSSPPSTLQA